MANAIFDDENPETVDRWAYPDTMEWDPERNTDEFVAALPRMADLGLDAITVNLQGGNPIPPPGQNDQPWFSSGFEADGSLKTDYSDRLDRVITAASREGVVVMVGFFYFGQDHRIEDEQAVLAAADNATDWLIERGFKNVLVEIANESNVNYDDDVLQPHRVHELIERVQRRTDSALLVSTSFGGGFIPSETVIDVSDFVLLHGNNQSPDEVSRMVTTVEGMEVFAENPKPIVFNEDSTSLDNMRAAVDVGASWGYHDKGLNDYDHGYQAPPVNWGINTSEKVATGPLDDATAAGDVVIRLGNATTAESARWYLDDPFLDGEPVDVDQEPPFVLNVDSSERLDTTALSDGNHIVNVLICWFDGTETWLSATLRVDNRAERAQHDD